MPRTIAKVYRAKHTCDWCGKVEVRELTAVEYEQEDYIDPTHMPTGWIEIRLPAPIKGYNRAYFDKIVCRDKFVVAQYQQQFGVKVQVIE